MRCQSLIAAALVVSVCVAAQAQTEPAASTAPASSTPAPASQPMPSASARAQAPAAPSPVTVYLEADDPNTALQVRPESAARNPRLAGVDGWEHACMAPCGIRLDPSLEYRVGGAGLSASYGFFLPKGQDPVTVQSKAGSAGRDHWGRALTLTGAGLLLLSGITIASMARAGSFKNMRDGDTEHTVLVSGLTTMVIGGLLMVVGVPIAWGAGTSIRVEPQPKRVAVTPAGIAF